MRKIPQVETAKALMKEAMTWSVMKWLREKKTVRRAADQANQALDRLSDELKNNWPADVKTAYEFLTAQSKKANGKVHERGFAKVEAQASLFARQVKDADAEAFRARMIAEKTFDDAEKRLSTSLAREGCLKAIQAWELQEKAIHKAEQICP